MAPARGIDQVPALDAWYGVSRLAAKPSELGSFDDDPRFQELLENEP